MTTEQNSSVFCFKTTGGGRRVFVPSGLLRTTHFILQELWYVVDGAEDDDGRHVLGHPGPGPLRDVAVPVGERPAHRTVPVTVQTLQSARSESFSHSSPTHTFLMDFRQSFIWKS